MADTHDAAAHDDVSHYLDPAHLFAHVQDADHFEVPRFVSPTGRIDLPQPLKLDKPIVLVNTGVKDIDQIFLPLELRLTKFMVVEVVAAILISAVFIVLANRIRGGSRPRGKLTNALEMMLVFIRDEVARPAIGKHDADRFLPFLWTMFFFVLGCNLLGMFPWTGTATASLATTGALALITFGTVVGVGMAQSGPLGFFKSLVPHMGLRGPLGVILVLMIFAIELLGLLIKHFVLAIRLLANMLAGHLVLAVILAFIAVTYSSPTWWGVMPASLFGATALSLLELLVAFLQAYIFTFLSALFIGSALHPH